MRLSGKRVLAVGASSGIGQASASAAAKEGARVCFASRRADRIEEAARNAGNDGFALACDVRDESSCRSVVDEATRIMGGLDAIVYAPGISTFGPIEDIDADAWRAVLETNLIGASLILNSAIVPSLMLGWSATSTSLMMDRDGTLMPVLAWSIETPGRSRANRYTQ